LRSKFPGDLWRTIDLYGKETVAMHDPTVPGKMESIAQFIVRTHTYSESTDEDLWKLFVFLRKIIF